nr:hypothetical protein [Tanacetum cinerariifolium]
MSTHQDINAFRAQRIANTHDPLALMENTQTPFHPDHSSHITYLQHPQPNNNFVQQPSFNTSYMQQPMINPKDISDHTTAFDLALELMSKAFRLNNTTTTNNNQRSSSNPCYSQIAQLGMNIDQDRQRLMVDNNVGNQFRENAMQNVGHLVGQNAGQNHVAQAEGNSNGINRNPIRCYNCQGEDRYASNCTVKPKKRDVAYLQQQLQIAQKDEASFQLTFEEFDFMAATGACEETERDNVNYTLEKNLQQASTSGTQSDKALVYDSDGSAEKLENENVELEFQVLNYAKENAHIKTTYKNSFDSISMTWTQTKTIIDSLQTKLHDTIYENAKLRVQLFDKVFEQKDTTRGTSADTKFAKQSIFKKPPSSRPKLYVVTPLPKSMAFPKVGEMNALSNQVTSNLVPSSKESNVVKNDNSWNVYSIICSTNYSNGENQVVSKSFAVTTADASDKRQQQQDSTSSTSTLATTVTADGNFDL